MGLAQAPPPPQISGRHGRPYNSVKKCYHALGLSVCLSNADVQIDKPWLMNNRNAVLQISSLREELMTAIKRIAGVYRQHLQLQFRCSASLLVRYSAYSPTRCRRL